MNINKDVYIYDSLSVRLIEMFHKNQLRIVIKVTLV